MFFKKKVGSTTPKTFMTIEINEHTTYISISQDHGNYKLEPVSIDCGFKDVIETSYKEALFFNPSNNYGDIESFFQNHYNRVYSHIVNFVKRIEFTTLCKMRIPCKIEKIYLTGDGSKLFHKELSSIFPNCEYKKNC